MVRRKSTSHQIVIHSPLTADSKPHVSDRRSSQRGKVPRGNLHIYSIIQQGGV